MQSGNHIYDYCSKKLRNPLVLGTAVLTITGFISRFIGFFYRIYLTNLFGPEGMGIYQLITPVMAISYALTAAGIQTAISKYVASESSSHNYRLSFLTLFVGFLIAILVSIFCSTALYRHSDYIACHFLMEIRTAPLLRIFALSIPLSTVHSCINGYYYGIRKTAIPSVSQLVEQLFRVSSVFVINQYFCAHSLKPEITIAVAGLAIGEVAGAVLSVTAILLRANKKLTMDGTTTKSRIHTSGVPASYLSSFSLAKGLITLALPFSANRLVINLLQSVEAAYIPNKLLEFGLDHSTALGVYGVLTGMCLPLILFPSAITNSISVLLLPVIADADASNNRTKIHQTVRQTFRICLLLGCFCTGFFLICASFLGNFLFHSQLAGSFISILSFLCPMMYITNTFNSVLNGIGKTSLTFCFSVISLSVRLLFVFYGIPLFGIKGYLWGILVSQFVHFLLNVLFVTKYCR